MTGSMPTVEVFNRLPTVGGRAAAAIIVGVDAKGRPTMTLPWLDGTRKAAVVRAARLFPAAAKPGALVGPVSGAAPDGRAVYLLRLPAVGDAAGWENGAAERLGEAVVARLAADGFGTLLLALGAGKGAHGARRLALLATGARLAGYRFDMRTKARPDDAAKIGRIVLVVPGAAAVRRALQPLDAEAEGVAFARDLVNQPGNRLYPASMAAQIVRRLKPLGVDIEVLAPPALRRLGMGGILAVGGGSAHPPRLVIMRWRGRNGARSGRAAVPVALVGKGVTFDTGGIDIKPGARMEEMKGDMAGAAAVAGAMLALALRGHRGPVIGVMPLVENMPSGTAYRPGDVVRSHDGRTVEIIDTDAEGRVILADALSYTAARFRPRAIVDLATLTGSVISALGHIYAGIFASDDRLAAALIAAGKPVGERLWRLPLDPDYAANLKSEIADIRQFAPDEESADAVHAAQFLQDFVGKTPWAHLDIAGVEFLRGEGRHGGSGFAVRLLTGYVAGQAARRG